MKKEIVVFGATGRQGGAVLRALLRSGEWHVVGLTRDPGSVEAIVLKESGAEVRRADLQDQGSVLAAIKGVYGVFALTQPWSAAEGRYNTEKEIIQGKNIVWACKLAGIKHVVFSSMVNPGNRLTGVSFVDSKVKLEEHFKRQDLPYTIIRCGLYMDNLNLRYRENGNHILKSNFAPKTLVPYIALSDIGTSVAGVFAYRERYLWNTIDLIGDLVTGEEITALLNQKYGHDCFTFSPASKLLLRLFQTEVYHLRRFLEGAHDPLHGAEMQHAFQASVNNFPELLNVAAYLEKSNK